MIYKIINQYGKIIDGKERIEIIKTYLLGLEEAFFEQGTANIVEVILYDNETIINVEVTIFNRGISNV